MRSELGVAQQFPLPSPVPPFLPSLSVFSSSLHPGRQETHLVVLVSRSRVKRGRAGLDGVAELAVPHFMGHHALVPLHAGPGLF